MMDDVLGFWFAAEPQQWFTKDPAFDAAIRERFGGLHAEVAAGGHAEWHATTRGALALILVLDQFSRNLFREDARAFAQDGRAVAITLELIGSDRIRELDANQRMFALLPLEHAEDRELQREAVAQFEAMVTELGPGGMLGMALDYAKKHAAIIERFGRFPHRNAVLGRVSSPDELTFLAEPGSSF